MKNLEHDSYADELLRKVYAHPEVLVNFDLLKGIGVLESFELLVGSFKDLEELQQKAVSIFSIDELDQLYSYITESILQKFIPTWLLFAVRADRFSQRPELSCYKNLKKVNSPIEVDSLAPFKELFEGNPGLVDFEKLDDQHGGSSAVSSMSGLSPRLVLPIQGGGELYGFILIGKKLLDEGYSDAEIFFIQTLIQYASVAIQNIISRKWAITDGKTGLYCYSFFKDRLDKEVARANRHNRPLSVMLVDIDHFKYFNDTYGHQAGDDAIIQLSRLMESATRAEDLIARFGGDEFIIMLPETDASSAAAIGERIRREVSELVVGHGDSPGTGFSVSIGAATYHPLENETGETLVENADRALYRSKSAGRNRVSVEGFSLMDRAQLLTDK